jgi:hypothetical protein
LPKAEVVVLGSGLKTLMRAIQKYELKFVKSADRRYAAALKTHITAVTVTFIKNRSKNPRSYAKFPTPAKNPKLVCRSGCEAEFLSPWLLSNVIDRVRRFSHASPRLRCFSPKLFSLTCPSIYLF